ncbi:hypothetical protein LX16_3690 [Stackebrandtia albiflava]|uniref:Uncharacterized protein n=1 Tax=Stackebrandtia albiflava TaxID=406432 RepID=A0A562V4W9_9ACTN|nr:hypothetical protein [Stackebrandtia albiflava]TWJ12923.1 hypothetical protein LX16_3690 [Stackebrandtia albiflava]
MYRQDAPHGTATSVVPAPATTLARLLYTTTQATIKNGTEKMNLLHEALARARMREVWRGEHRHRRRGAREVMLDVRRRTRGF